MKTLTITSTTTILVSDETADEIARDIETGIKGHSVRGYALMQHDRNTSYGYAVQAKADVLSDDMHAKISDQSYTVTETLS